MLLRLAAALAACLLAGPALAQSVCAVGPPEEILARLLANNGQVPLITMQISQGDGAPTMPAILAIDPDGAWSILFLAPTGNLCFLGAGTGAQPSTGPGFPKPVIPGQDS